MSEPRRFNSPAGDHAKNRAERKHRHEGSESARRLLKNAFVCLDLQAISSRAVMAKMEQCFSAISCRMCFNVSAVILPVTLYSKLTIGWNSRFGWSFQMTSIRFASTDVSSISAGEKHCNIHESHQPIIGALPFGRQCRTVDHTV